MYTDIDAVTNLLIEERIWNTVEPFVTRYNAEQKTATRPPSPTTTILRKRSRQESSSENQ